MKKIAIYGAGGLGREVLMLIRQINLAGAEWQPIGFFDDAMQKGKEINGLPVLGGIADLNGWTEELFIVMAIGNTKAKKMTLESISNTRVTFPVLVHPGVQLEEFQNVTIGEGSIIAAGNILTTDIKIGKHVLMNLNCTIGHDVEIANFASIMPGCNISGEVKIAEGAYLGTGSSIINRINVGEFAVVGAGAVVINDLEAGSTAVGVPAKVKTEK